MKTGRLEYCILLFFLTLFSACSTGEDYKPWLIGDIYGRVYTFDQYGFIDLEYSGVKITLYGSKPEYHSVTNRRGEFKILDVPNGTYNIRCEKEGYGTLKQFGIQHLGGKPTVLENIYYLYKIQDYRITDIEINNDSIRAKVALTGNLIPETIILRIFMSSQPGFDPSFAPFTVNYILRISGGSYTGSTKSHYGAFTDSYYGNYFKPGETLYFRGGVFTYVGGGVDHYFDDELKQWIYPNIGELSDEYSFQF